MLQQARWSNINITSIDDVYRNEDECMEIIVGYILV